MKKFFYTYKVVLLRGSLAGHYYYGQHQTKKLKDGYIGSGSRLKAYFKKYPPIEGVTYTRQILAFYSDEDELNLAEKMLIGDLYETDPFCLNCKGGGDSYAGRLSQEARENMSKAQKGKTWSLERRERASQQRKGIPKGPSKLRGRKRDPEAVKKSAEGHRGKKRPLISEDMSSRKWVNDGTRNYRIPEKEILKYLQEGYFLGTIKKNNLNN